MPPQAAPLFVFFSKCLDTYPPVRYDFRCMGMFELNGQTAIVTGAATGIGEAIARRLAAAGAIIAVADRD
jgi:NADPH:quinone reductase-like Zn-dependent oxidoreductase